MGWLFCIPRGNEVGTGTSLDPGGLSDSHPVHCSIWSQEEAAFNGSTGEVGGGKWVSGFETSLVVHIWVQAS